MSHSPIKPYLPPSEFRYEDVPGSIKEVHDLNYFFGAPSRQTNFEVFHPSENQIIEMVQWMTDNFGCQSGSAAEGGDYFWRMELLTTATRRYAYEYPSKVLLGDAPYLMASQFSARFTMMNDVAVAFKLRFIG